jgi:hypothetical protein
MAVFDPRACRVSAAANLGGRFVIAGPLIGLLARFASFAELGRAVRLLLPAALAFAVSMMAWIFGLKQTTNPCVAAFITSTGYLLVPVFGLLFAVQIGRLKTTPTLA